jgi:hypothetical protein
MPIRRPCLWCGKLGDGTRCNDCEKKRQAILAQRQSLRPKPDRPHYKGNYKARAKKVREEAQFCWICGGGPREHDPWTADHVIPADPESLLLPAHRSCNSSRGNRINKAG